MLARLTAPKARSGWEAAAHSASAPKQSEARNGASRRTKQKIFLSLKEKIKKEGGAPKNVRKIFCFVRPALPAGRRQASAAAGGFCARQGAELSEKMVRAFSIKAHS